MRNWATYNPSEVGELFQWHQEVAFLQILSRGGINIKSISMSYLLQLLRPALCQQPLWMLLTTDSWLLKLEMQWEVTHPIQCPKLLSPFTSHLLPTILGTVAESVLLHNKVMAGPFFRQLFDNSATLRFHWPLVFSLCNNSQSDLLKPHPYYSVLIPPNGLSALLRIEIIARPLGSAPSLAWGCQSQHKTNKEDKIFAPCNAHVQEQACCRGLQEELELTFHAAQDTFCNDFWQAEMLDVRT